MKDPMKRLEEIAREAGLKEEKIREIIYGEKTKPEVKPVENYERHGCGHDERDFYEDNRIQKRDEWWVERNRQRQEAVGWREMRTPWNGRTDGR
ncbi:hypothetical protein J4468_03215 [Candidatus Woesearchaeota archaeon]|nr:hypothetical protein [Candidatus Woesearchaeota archaeon]